MTISPRHGVVALATLLLLALGPARATACVTIAGETIVHVGDGGHEAWMIGQSQDVGYKYEYVAVLCMDLWSWGGTYCVYQRFDNKYWPITTAEAARLLKKPEAEMQPPWRYRYPLGLFVFGPIFLLAAVGWVLSERTRQAAEDATKLTEDPRYREAGAIALAGDVAAEAAFENGVQHLVGTGMDRASAERHLKVLVRSAVTCPGCGRRYPAGAPACGCGGALPAMPPEAAPVKVDRPFDLGKPLGTPHPVSGACPACGSGEYKSVQPAAMVSFTFDRMCTACKTRYTPPTPTWARVVFGLIGAGAIAGGAAILYLAATKGGAPARLYVAAAVMAAVGAACLYKAATK